MKRGSKQKSAPVTGVSSLLSFQENELLEDLLGRRCASLCTTVVQMFMALPHSQTTWSQQQTGVICFVKDNRQRSYFIRLYDLKAHKLVWEQELYNQITYHKVQPFFHTFPGDNCQVGLNFANEQEAENFFTIVDEKISQRNDRLERHQGRATSSREHEMLPPPPLNGSGNLPLLPLGNMNIQNEIAPTKSKKEKKEKEKKNKKKGSKLSKALIGAPSGFTHVGHLGMDSNSSSIDPDLLKLLSRAGISEADLRDSETSKMIREVIENSGGMEAVKMELSRDRGPPPPGARHSSLPPPPPSTATIPSSSQARLGPLPPPPTHSSGESQRSQSFRGPLPPAPGGGRRGPLPQPPPPSSTSSSSQPHSAPMPVRSGSLPPVPGGRSGSLPPVPGGHAAPPSSSSLSRSGPLPPPPPGRSSGGPPPPPPSVGGRRESLPPAVPGGHNGPQPSYPRGRSVPPPVPKAQNMPSRPLPVRPPSSAGSVPSLPSRRGGGGPLPPPPSEEIDWVPPPPVSSYESDLPPPPSNFYPSSDVDNLPPPTPSESCFYPPSNNQFSDIVAPAPSLAGPPPPPPPPPPPADVPPPPPPGIQAPRPSGPPPPVTGGGGEGGGGGRGALLDQIRSGMKLKTVTPSLEPASPVTSDTSEGIVGALMMVMQKRSKVIHSSDEGDEFDDEEDDDDDWD